MMIIVYSLLLGDKHMAWKILKLYSISEDSKVNKLLDEVTFVQF